MSVTAALAVPYSITFAPINGSFVLASYTIPFITSLKIPFGEILN